MAEYRNPSRLFYVDAGDIDDDRVDYDGLDVLDPAGQKLGDVDGFIVQEDTRRPYYIVVDSGGWFSSRSFLVPIGHARLDAGNKALRVDLDKSVVQRFPDYDSTRFAQMSDEESRQFTERTLGACCAKELQARTGADRYDYDKWSHYAQPDWWPLSAAGSSRQGVRSERLASDYTNYTVPPASVPAPGALHDETVRREHEEVVARDRAGERDVTAGRDIDVVPTREETVVRDQDVRDTSRLNDRPLDRAQPGDVLGIEKGGETTSLGDTARDERARREDAEEDAADLRRRNVKDRS